MHNADFSCRKSRSNIVSPPSNFLRKPAARQDCGAKLGKTRKLVYLGSRVRFSRRVPIARESDNPLFGLAPQDCRTIAKEEARAKRAQRAGSTRKWISRLFDFDVVACVDLAGTQGNHHRGRVASDVEDKTLPKNFSGQIVPFISLRRAPEAVHHVLIVFRLWHRLGPRALVPENAEVIADLNP